MKNKTAVEWFDIESRRLSIRIENKEISIGEFAVSYHELFNQAKQMEREQIEEAYNQDLYGGLSGDRKYENGSDYFTKTYNDGKESK